jgi:hypothetical protein
MTTKTLDLDNIERKLFWTFSAVFVGLLAFYLYAVISLTVAGVERGHLTLAAQALASQVGDLEREYMNIQNGVTLARAQELGFHEVIPKFTGSPADNSSIAKLSFAQ